MKVLLSHSWHHIQQEITAGDTKNFLRSLPTCSFLKFHDASSGKTQMVHVTYGKESSSCLLNSMYWFPADPFSFLPSLSGGLNQICQDGKQLQSGNQPD